MHNTGTRMKRRARLRDLVLALASAVLCALSSPALAGTIVSRTFASVSLQRDWTYNLYVPDGYEESALLYPVLYLLHGNGGDRASWVLQGRIQRTADALIARGEIPPCLIVMPEGGTSWYVDAREKMESALIADLLPEVQKHWRTLPTRGGRLIAGVSMGGYGAARFALKYPELFAAAALLSPAIYVPEPPENSAARTAGVFGAPDFSGAAWRQYNYPALWEAYRAKNLPVALYIAAGDDDPYFIEQEAARFYLLLRRSGQPAELRIVDGAHDWPLWSRVTPEALRYIFGFAERPAPAARLQ